MSVQRSDLMMALGFSADDLAANHAGQLSETQTARLRAGWRRQVTVTAILVVTLMLAATFMLFFGQRGESPALTFIGMAITVINAVIVGVGAQNYLRLNGDLSRRGLLVTSGTVTRVVRVASGRASTFVIKLDGRDEVNVSKAVFNAFEEGRRYTLYRTAASKTLLSAEPL